jgi:hypothetical protein
MGEWLPLGAIASQRYALLKRIPVLPYEELLCKEMTAFADKFSVSDHKGLALSGGGHIHNCMKVPFVQLLRFQHYVRWSLVKMGARTHYKADIDVTVLCGICKRDCYVAHILCDCRVDAICLHHGKALLPLISYIYALFFWSSYISLPCFEEEEIRKCPCSCNRVVFVRKDIFELEALSEKFEEEIDVLDVGKQKSQNYASGTYPHLFEFIDRNVKYFPYCKIQIDASFEEHAISEKYVLGYDLNKPYPAVSTITFSHGPHDYSTQSDV